jgi:hypothetical protein
MKRGYFLLILLISALLIPASGCQSENKAIDLVPANAQFIAGIEFSKIIADQDIKGTYDKMKKGADQPQTFDEAMDELFQETGIDMRDLSRALIFGDISNVEQSEYVGIIAEGTFNETTLVNNMEENTHEEFTTTDYGDHTLYSDASQDFSLSFLNNKMLLGGNTQAVKDMIDVSNGESEPVKGQLLDTYNRHRDSLISLAMAVPEDAWDALANESNMGDMPFSMDAFRNMDLLGFSFDKEKSTLSSRIEAHFLGEDYVQDAYNTISGILTMLEGMADEPDLKAQLENIKISVSGSWITISYEIEIPQLDELMGTYGE